MRAKSPVRRESRLASTVVTEVPSARLVREWATPPRLSPQVPVWMWFRSERPSVADITTWVLPLTAGNVAEPDCPEAFNPERVTVTDSPGMSLESVNPDGSRRDRTDLLPRRIYQQEGNTGGQLSADFVSILMGYPVDWTVVGDGSAESLD